MAGLRGDTGSSVGMKPNLPAGFGFGGFVLGDQLMDRGENRGELLVIFLLHRLNARREVAVGIHQPPQLHKRPHDGNIHLHRAGRAQHAGQHGHALLGEGVGMGAAATPWIFSGHNL